jgi:hypothetical protein
VTVPSRVTACQRRRGLLVLLAFGFVILELSAMEQRYQAVLEVAGRLRGARLAAAAPAASPGPIRVQRTDRGLESCIPCTMGRGGMG